MKGVPGCCRRAGAGRQQLTRINVNQVDATVGPRRRQHLAAALAQQRARQQRRMQLQVLAAGALPHVQHHHATILGHGTEQAALTKAADRQYTGRAGRRRSAQARLGLGTRRGPACASPLGATRRTDCRRSSAASRLAQRTAVVRMLAPHQSDPMAWFQGSVHSGVMALSPLCRPHSRRRPSLQAAPSSGPSGWAATPNR